MAIEILPGNVVCENVNQDKLSTEYLLRQAATALMPADSLGDIESVESFPIPLHIFLDDEEFATGKESLLTGVFFLDPPQSVKQDFDFTKLYGTSTKKLLSLLKKFSSATPNYFWIVANYDGSNPWLAAVTQDYTTKLEHLMESILKKCSQPHIGLVLTSSSLHGMDFNNLNIYFRKHSFAQGFKLSEFDFSLCATLPNGWSREEFPNLARWSDHVRASWGDYPMTLKLKPKSALLPVVNLQEPQLKVDNANEEEEKETVNKKKKKQGKSKYTIDVKPLGLETDLATVELAVRAIKLPGLRWLGEPLNKAQWLDVAYGIKKIRISAELVDELVPDTDVIRELIEVIDGVQSTDLFAIQMAS